MSIPERDLLELEAVFRSINIRLEETENPIRLDFDSEGSKLEIILHGPELTSLLTFWSSRADSILPVCNKNSVKEILCKYHGDPCRKRFVNVELLNRLGH